MLNVIISGCNGHMGRVVEYLCAADPEVQVAAGFDVLGSTDRDFPVYSSPAQFTGRADAVIDFSSPAALEGLLAFGKATKTPLILATTGYTPEQVAQIGAAALEVPIFRSANMSLGINVLLELVKKAASILGDSYDIEIVERHHRRKVDAPSGTALMIADAAAQSCGHETEYVLRRSTSLSATRSATPGTRRRSASPPSGGAPSWGSTRSSSPATTRSWRSNTPPSPGRSSPRGPSRPPSSWPR